MNILKNAPPGFCLAKWYYLSVDLNTGTAHSCYHPPEHKIDLKQLPGNEYSIHNSKHNIKQRKEMLQGQRPTECSYCWKMEESNPERTSERHIKSSDKWAKELLLETLLFNGNEIVFPRYLEVNFDNLCNLNCSYCSGTISSSIAQEIKKFGPYKVHSNFGRNPEGLLTSDEKKLLLESFWIFFKKCYLQLKTLRITGGEPLLSNQLEQVLKYISVNPNPDLELAINSNLSVPHEKTVSLINNLKQIRIKKFSIYTSIETTLTEAKYIRHGLNISLFKKNLTTILEENPKIEVVIMSTFHILSIFKFKDFLIWIEGLKNQYPNLILDISYLERPEFLSADLATLKEFQHIVTANNYMQESTIFSNYEKSKLAMITSLLQKTIESPSTQLSLYRSDFYSFITEYDRRFQLNFLQTFPEAKPFYELTRKHYLFEHFKDEGE